MLNRLRAKIREEYFKWGGIKLEPGLNHIDGGIVRKSKSAVVSIGNCFSIRKYAILNISENGILMIGRNVFINYGTKINVRDSVNIGDNCIIGQDVLIYDHDHDYKSENRRDNFVNAPVSIGKNVWIGSDVIILKGTSIGDNAVIAAGSIVKGEVPANTLYYRKLGESQMKDISDC
ncbi:acyltransferase [Lactococcus lactis]|uniref:acyltransferase n=1 Tax=Lactococcus lactis TaxID=1358 RepID=UPI003A295DCE